MSNDAVYPSLKNKVVLVTGGASGIGESITRAMIKQGAKVGFLDFDEEAATKLLNELGTDNINSQICDLRDIDQLKNSVQEVSKTLGAIDVLVNNAARDDRHSLESITSEYFDERIATNLKHQLL